MAKTLLEQVTREGKLDLYSPKLNDPKIAAADNIVAGIAEGSNAAVQAFKEHLGCRFGEAIHTTGDDFIYAFAQLTAFEVSNEWEPAERTWSDAIEAEDFASFDTPTSYSIMPVTTGFKRPNEPGKPNHVVPKVGEGQPYPHFTFSGDAAQAGGIGKAGGRYDLTFEMIVKDVAGIVPTIPKLITESLLEREEYDAWYGLISFIDTPANHLTADTTIDGVAVPADSLMSRASLAAAIKQARNRKINGRKVKVRSYNLIVPTGEKETAEWYLNTLQLNGLSDTTGTAGNNTTRSYSLNGFNPLSAISGVVETDYLSGTQWALVPAKGSIRGNDKFYKLGRLRGHVGPELRLQNVTGQYLGGGNVAPFEGSFDTDSAAFRGRIIGGGVGWNPEYAVISDGTGTP